MRNIIYPLEIKRVNLLNFDKKKLFLIFFDFVVKIKILCKKILIMVQIKSIFKKKFKNFIPVV